MNDIDREFVMKVKRPETPMAPVLESLASKGWNNSGPIEQKDHRHVISLSGGVTSWAAARVVKDIMEPGEEMVLLFADTLVESQDVYEFLARAVADINEPFCRIADGRTIWDVFRDEKFLGNNRFDPCSKILKRKLINKWLDTYCVPGHTTVHVGLDWMEINRFEKWQKRMEGLGWDCCAPLIDARVDKAEAINMAKARGLELPAAYEQGFSHANCNGMCVKAGKGHWARLYVLDPETYKEAEKQERERSASSYRRTKPSSLSGHRVSCSK